MKAAVFQERGKPLSVETVADPRPEQGEVIVRVNACGICGTDLHATEDETMLVPPGTVLGHEFSGEVVEVGAGVSDGWRKGDRLCTLPFIGCGSCLSCLSGEPWMCPTKKIIGFEIPGGFAEYARVHVNEAVRLPEAVSSEEGALVEPLSVGLHAVRLARGIEGKNVLVVGAGPIGLAVAMWCKFFGARHVVTSEFDAARAKSALDFGATALVDARGDVAEQFQQVAGTAPEVIFECVGIPGVIGQCVDLAAFRAELIVVGFCMRPDSFVPALAMLKELSFKFSIGSNKSDFQFIVDMAAAKRIDVGGMISKTLSFDEFPSSFEGLRKGSSHCKVLLQPWT